MPKAGQVFLACALGAFIGGVIAKQVWSGFWWLGLIGGFVVGYLSYDFLAVCRAVRSVWRKMTGMDVRHRCLLWQLFGFVFWLEVFVITFILGISLTWWSLVTSIPHSRLWSFLLILSVDVVPAVSAIMLLVLFGHKDFRNPTRRLTDEEMIIRIQWCIKYLNLFMLLTYWPVRGLIFLLRKSPQAVYKAVCFLGRFAKLVFIAIHSDIRLLCATDAALFALVGIHLGNPALGALVGGIFGVANYYVVSVKLLRLHQERA